MRFAQMTIWEAVDNELERLNQIVFSDSLKVDRDERDRAIAQRENLQNALAEAVKMGDPIE